MIRYASLASNYLRIINHSRIVYSPYKIGLATSSRLYASDGRKKGPTIYDGGLKRNTNNHNSNKFSQETPIPNQSPPKIVQVRPQSSKAAPIPVGPTPTPTPPTPSTPPPSSNSGGWYKYLIGILVAAGTVGGLYYSGIIDGSDSKKASQVEKKKKWRPRPPNRNPPTKEDFPAKVPYLLIGGGTASFAAFRAIKSKDPTAKVLVISAEDSLPYMRPPLSKEIWQQGELSSVDKLTFKQWNGQERSLFYEPSEFYLNIADLESSPNGGVVVATGWVVSRVDPVNNSVEVEDPNTGSYFTLQYDKCLIATGSRPKNLPVFEEASPDVVARTVLLRNVRDLEYLWEAMRGASSVAVVGGGFLGSELACSLARKFKDNKGPKVHQVFKETGNMGRVLPEYLSQWTTARVSEEGVNVIPSVEVIEANNLGNKVMLSLSNGRAISADVVVVAVGSEPCTQLSETSPLEVDSHTGGFLVNAELEARSNLYVAGDAACFYDPTLGRRRVEHHDHAVVSGRLAGENMAGAAKPYKHQSMFWSDLGPDVGYEAIGIVDSCLPTVAVFAKGGGVRPESAPDRTKEDNQTAAKVVEAKPAVQVANVDSKPINLAPVPAPVAAKEETPKPEAVKNEDSEYQKGIIFYLKKDMVVGIVLWNVFNRMHVARQVLAERRKYDDLNEVAKLFNLHED